MAGFLRKLFKGKHHGQDSGRIERELDNRESKRSSSRKNSRYDRDYETSSTAAYHTETQPRPYRATRSYAAGEISDEEDRYEYLNRSLELKRPREENFSRRRGYSKNWRRRCNTSEYGSADPSPTNLMYDPTLDDSESDYMVTEREKLIYELEKKRLEDREKIKAYRERLKMERELREKEISALKGTLKKMRKKDEKEKRDLMNVITSLQSKVNFLEQQQRCGSMFPPLFEGVVGAGESLCTMSASSVPAPSGFSHSALHNNSDEIDETKNFRRTDAYDTELPRSSNSSSSINTSDVQEVTLLENDHLNNLTLTLDDSTNRRVHSDSDLCRSLNPLGHPASLRL